MGTIQQHARDKHNLHQGVTVLQPGLISSKMFDKSPDRTCCDDKTSAKFQPLELCFNDQLFYCYFERVCDRRLWFFSHLKTLFLPATLTLCAFLRLMNSLMEPHALLLVGVRISLDLLDSIKLF